MGSSGLYYYYHTAAKALDAAGVKELTDADGKKHDWRRDLVAELVKRQRPDGSWVNSDDALDGRRAQPGDRLRPADAFLLQAG